MKVGHCKDCDETLPCLLQAFPLLRIDHCKFKEEIMSEVETPQISQIELLASGLDSPRKLSFGPDGALHNGPG